MIKIVTGLRRCGKSYLLFVLFRKHLKEQGIDDKHIIMVDLGDCQNVALRNSNALFAYIDSQFVDGKMHYIFIDEVQLVPDFSDVLNGFLKVQNADVYVTGSNAKFLSKDVIANFRDRIDEIRITPLSFREFVSVRANKNQTELLEEYALFGGLPQVVLKKNQNSKIEELKNLFVDIYIKDIKERHKLHNDAFEELINIIATNIGELTNPTKLSNTFKTEKHSNIKLITIKKYLDLLQDEFLINKSIRYDIEEKRYINTPSKYYFEDLGLRNARMDFNDIEFAYLFENAIYNELRLRGMSVDVGQVPIFTQTLDGKWERYNLQVNFVCNKDCKRYYIQSTIILFSSEELNEEIIALLKIKDGFQKFVIVGTPTPTYQNKYGIKIMNVYDFLIDENSLMI